MVHFWPEQPRVAVVRDDLRWAIAGVGRVWVVSVVIVMWQPLDMSIAVSVVPPACVYHWIDRNDANIVRVHSPIAGCT